MISEMSILKALIFAIAGGKASVTLRRSDDNSNS